MVHSAKQLRRTALVAGLALVVGCTSVDGFFGAARKETGPRPVLVQAMWLKQVQYLPDPTKQGEPAPALVGMVYFFPEDKIGGSDDKPAPSSSQSIPADGKLIVDLYDDTPRASGKETKSLERTTYPAEVLAKLKQRDPLLGIGYTVAVPWGTYSRDIKQVHFAIRFEPTDGSMPLSASSSVVTLDHGNPPSQVLQAAAKQLAK